MATQQLRRPPGSSGLYDVLELILDRGLVIDAYARVSLVGIELLTVDLRVVVASVDTYIRYAEAIERLGWHERASSVGLPDLVSGMSSTSMTRQTLRQGTKQVADAVTDNGDGRQEHAGEHRGVTGALARGAEKLKGTFSGSEGGDENRDEAAGAEQHRGGEAEASSEAEGQQHDGEHGGEHQ